MKKILIVIILFAFKASAQSDSTIVLNQGFQARLIEYLDRQCTAVETAFINGIIATRLIGRKFLLGR